jgi:hypothetical protein
MMAEGNLILLPEPSFSISVPAAPISVPQKNLKTDFSVEQVSVLTFEHQSVHIPPQKLALD